MKDKFKINNNFKSQEKSQQFIQNFNNKLAAIIKNEQNKIFIK